MSVAELKQQVETLSQEEKLELSAFLKHIARRDDPAHQVELARIMREMDRGRKFSAQDVERLRATRGKRSA
jgi:hypothetical protein